MRISGLGAIVQVPHPILFPRFTGLNGLGVAQIIDPSIVQEIAGAIIQQEGVNPAFSPNNNPGNLVYAGQTGAVPGAGGFAKFPTYDAGVQALDNQIQLYASRGMTIQQMMSTYAPAGQGGNDPVLYAQVVAAAVQATPDTALTDIGQTYPTDNPMNISPAGGAINPGVFAGVVLAGLVGILILSPSS